MAFDREKKKIAGELRRSQMLTTFGSGALVDMPHFSGIVSGIDSWPVWLLKDEDKIIHEKNLEEMLGKRKFIQVASPEATAEGDEVFGIPAFRFPKWYYCPKCHRLDRFERIAKDPFLKGKNCSDLLCDQCKEHKKPVKLVPSRFIIACMNGHLDDFPYDWWVTKGSYCKDRELFLEYAGNTGGLDSIVVTCKNKECGKKCRRSMAGCMDKNGLKGYKCQGAEPWFNYDGKFWYKDPEPCNATVRGMQRSANNVYYAVNQSALTVPPFSDRLQKHFNEKSNIFEDIFSDEEQYIDEQLDRYYRRNSEALNCTLEEFKKAVKAWHDPADEGNIPTEQDLRKNEYKSFIGVDCTDTAGYLRTETVDVPEDFLGLIAEVKLVHKLREVMVLKGFRRILPMSEITEELKAQENLNNNAYSPICKNPAAVDWLPAIELFGEGIFIRLDEEAVSSWEETVGARYAELIGRNKSDFIGNGMACADSPRYILLHTLSHLLIRQLAAQCGYATASIKEKIYSTFKGDEYKMSGILIYTSATDTDGSLGGLVREGMTDRLGDTLQNMLSESSWCSNDPICIDASSQGFNGLNKAACHACALLPETSCESLNCLLDRAAIVGTPDNPDIAFFNKLL